MPTPQEAIEVLVPTAYPEVHYSCNGDGIVWWNHQSPQPTPEELAAVTAEQVAQARLTNKRTAAQQSFFTRDDDTAFAVRSMFKAVVFLINNRLDGTSTGRVTEAEILAYIAANPNLGDPAT